METIRPWIIFGLFGLMLIKACLIPLLYLDYEIRYDYIVVNLCENRDRPQLDCKGKCYLAKRVAQAQKQEQKQAEQGYMSKLLLQPMLIHSTQLPRLIPANSRITKVLFNYLSPAIKSVSLRTVFHPPLLG
ncbi:hypothetical protein [Dyadobacter tibetensis]|uniref:hypothetical protein n=1 Tax=Dyadobacter tibetensis TaxID=1211851 RepID=UPI001039C7FC|nr:hypothetical protein [Dyadobacter tibetensis]